MKTVDWQELAAISHYLTAVAIRNALREDHVAGKMESVPDSANPRIDPILPV